ncbi:MAG TPA: tyrosine--tRNA ligase [Candidatus Aminicenantes bacterium]|nr:tyrosine--tRNA ligase [Candidatus Aminicenantes bacterium]HRY64640.1 tyrosine--tRNA ligase [Candidatus Aminicenantes bacterium]HRZ71553.1 tyrosine--tRNA ligase [Candidatus Aminicenantes bacterium]
MSGNVYDEIKERGFVAQVSDEEAVRKALGGEQITFYVGFDSTATSLHAGSLVPIMAMSHLRRAGHRVIAVVGSGTTMVGDPSGKTEMRPMLEEATIRAQGQAIHLQLARYLHFDGQNAIAVDNADWLLPLHYVPFLRDIGRHFSVNRMLAAEAYKLRLERGLSFIEFNYQILQAYDYLTLFRKYGCSLQMGGDDQWGNILAGVDLIRRVEGGTAQALTFPLLTTATGAKMGKTAQGAVWLDGALFSPYDFYQYWVNCDDRDVGRFLRLFTLLPLDEIRRLEALENSGLNEAKRILAFEATKITHGELEAEKARQAAAAAFGGGPDRDAGGGAGGLDALPTTAVPRSRLEAGIAPAGLFAEIGLTPSRKEAKRMIEQGGLYVNDERIDSVDRLITLADLRPDGGLLLKAGKKKVHRLVPA